jgi:putative zinc finger protein
MTDEITSCLPPSEVLAYLEGTLSPARRAVVDRHLEECRLCEAAIQGAATLEWQEGFLRSTDALLARVRARTSTAATAAAPVRRRALRFRHAPHLLALAATVVVGVGTAIVLTRSGPRQALLQNFEGAGAGTAIVPTRSGPGEALFRQNFEPYPSTRPVVRGDRTAGSPGALALYEAGDYRGALPGLEDNLRRDPNDREARFYAGICRLALGRTREATLDLEQVLSAGDEDLREPAEWYLALARLRANDHAGARAQLERIAASEGFYRDRARALLPELDRLGKRD